MAHAGHHHRGPRPRRVILGGFIYGHLAEPMRTQVVPCDCQAYNWPHRPGGGLCRWPESPLRTFEPSPWRSHKITRKQYNRALARIQRAARKLARLPKG